MIAMNKLDAKRKAVHIIWTLLYTAAFVLSMVGCAINHWTIFALFKSLFMPMVSILAYVQWTGPFNKQFYLLQLAFLFAWLGDVFLAFQKTHSLFFIIGACFFLIQHNFYIWLNLLSRGKPISIIRAPYWGLPNIAYVILFSVNCMADVNMIMRSECMIYSFFLGSSFYTAFYREMPNRQKYWTIVIGFAWFVLSDILLAVDKFLYPMTQAQGSSILFTYYVAQTLICLGNLPDVETTQ